MGSNCFIWVPEIILKFSAFFWLAVWFPAFSTIIALFGSWKLLELLYIGSEHKLRRIVSSISVQNLNWAAPAKFRTQIEQMRTHYKQPQFAFETNWRIRTLYEPQHKNLKCLLKIKGTLIKKNYYQASPVLTKLFKTIPLSDDSNLVTQSL